MAIDRLSSTSALLAALRAEGARKGERPNRDDATDATSTAHATTSGKRRELAVLRRELAEILKGIAPNDHAALDAARPRVVRAVLLWEFGSELREHDQWQPMLDRLVRTLEGSDQHRSEFSALISELSN
jgi:hypothetical protein